MQPESVRYPIFVCEQRTPHGNWRELCHSVCRTCSLHSPTADPIRSALWTALRQNRIGSALPQYAVAASAYSR
jgi:hypothetical protein